MALPNANMDFTAFDVLTADQLDDLVENDQALQNGSAFDSTSAISPVAFSNPYKFSVYRNAAGTYATSLTLVTFDTKNFDTGTNFSTATGIFTAPVAGFYFFSWGVQSSQSSGAHNLLGILYDVTNSAALLQGSYAQAAPPLPTSTGSGIVQLTLSQQVQIQAVADAAIAYGNGKSTMYFTGFLVSRA